MDANLIAMDQCHIDLISGWIKASKPKDVLELGIGSGRLTRAIQDALDYNMQGTLLSVDNWGDWGGNPPDELIKTLPQSVLIVTANEHEFLAGQPKESFDILISDADHNNSHKWIDEHLRLLRPGGVAFLHDTNDPMWPGLSALPKTLVNLGFRTTHFTQSTRPTERCGRGLLMIHKKGA